MAKESYQAYALDGPRQYDWLSGLKTTIYVHYDVKTDIGLAEVRIATYNLQYSPYNWVYDTTVDDPVVVPPPPWILATGFWDDSGIWDDSAVWID